MLSPGGLEAGRTAEILVALSGSAPGRRGSGYRVGIAHVLTAAHVVLGATAVRVRLDADQPNESVGPAKVVLAVPAADLALVELSEPTAGSPLAPPRYGSVPEQDLVLPCSAMGFPRFKLRDDPARPLADGTPSQYRDSCHATGTISVLSNRREGTLELAVAAPREDPDPARSPWEGMSGAAVWSDGVLVGIVSEHHRSEGLGRLAARRVDRWHTQLDRAALELLRDAAGFPSDAAELALVPGRALLVPDGLSLRSLKPLIDALVDTPAVRDAQSRDLILENTRPEVVGGAKRHPALRMDVISIVTTCLHYPSALNQLLDAIRMLEGDSFAVRRLNRVVSELAETA